MLSGQSGAGPAGPFIETVDIYFLVYILLVYDFFPICSKVPTHDRYKTNTNMLGCERIWAQSASAAEAMALTGAVFLAKR